MALGVCCHQLQHPRSRETNRTQQTAWRLSMDGREKEWVEITCDSASISFLGKVDNCFSDTCHHLNTFPMPQEFLTFETHLLYQKAGTHFPGFLVGRAGHWLRGKHSMEASCCKGEDLGPWVRTHICWLMWLDLPNTSDTYFYWSFNFDMWYLKKHL